jgi:hypothetical protein
VTTSSPINITVSASGTQAAFVTGATLGSLRNDFDGWLGTKFTVGASPLSVTALGRYVISGQQPNTHSESWSMPAMGPMCPMVLCPSR